MTIELTLQIEGIDTLKREWSSACDAFDNGAEKASKNAAEAGVDEIKQSHPYTDRTGDLTDDAHVVPGTDDGKRIAEMEWPEDYASYVDRKEQFNFTERAERVATGALERGTEHEVDKLCDRMNRL